MDVSRGPPGNPSPSSAGSTCGATAGSSATASASTGGSSAMTTPTRPLRADAVGRLLSPLSSSCAAYELPPLVLTIFLLVPIQ